MPKGSKRRGGTLTTVLQRLADVSKARKPAQSVLAAALIGAAIASVWLLVLSTNGTSNALLHMMYVPIIAASLCFGVLGGVVTALAGGFAMGPLMPLNIELGIAQSPENYLYRTAFFALVAASTGAFAQSARRRHELLQQAKSELAAINARNLRLFARLVADRDEKTGDHCERVARNAVMVGRVVGLEGVELRQLYWAGLLHDLGKLGVPEAILRKPGRLTSQEFEEIRRHPAFGERILLDISDTFTEIAKGARSHHERWDGSGYPDGLVGEEIPLSGRIIAVVDVYEAMTSWRPYRGPMDPHVARGLIAEGAGTHFDPRIVEVFLDLESRGLVTREAEPGPLFKDSPVAVFDSSPALMAASQVVRLRE